MPLSRRRVNHVALLEAVPSPDPTSTKYFPLPLAPVQHLPPFWWSQTLDQHLLLSILASLSCDM